MPRDRVVRENELQVVPKDEKLAGIVAVDVPVAARRRIPAAVVARQQGEAGDHPLATLVVAVQDVTVSRVRAALAALAAANSGVEESRNVPCQKPTSSAGT